MKTVVTKLFFVFFIFSASLYAQYFIDEDIIREHRNANKSYMDTSEVYNQKKVFLIRLGGQDGMKTNVYVGFDKTEYSKGDEVTLTFKRDNDERFNDYPYNVTLYPGGGRYERVFILNQGETKVEKIQLPENYNFHRINIGIRGENPLYESISFGISMNDVNTAPKLPEDSPNMLKHIPRKFDKNTSDSLRLGIKHFIIPLNDSGGNFQEKRKPKLEPNNKEDSGLIIDNQNSLESATMFTGRITYTYRQ